MPGMMICLLITMLLTFMPCRAAEKSTPAKGFLASIRFSDSVSPEREKTLYYDSLLKGRIDFTFLYRLDPTDYHLWVGLARPKGYFDLEQRLSRTLDPLAGYPGGQMLCDAVRVGMEFYTFAQDMTTYGNHTFHTGTRVKNTLGSSFKTGFFYNF